MLSITVARPWWPVIYDLDHVIFEVYKLSKKYWKKNFFLLFSAENSWKCISWGQISEHFLLFFLNYIHRLNSIKDHSWTNTSENRILRIKNKILKNLFFIFRKTSVIYRHIRCSFDSLEREFFKTCLKILKSFKINEWDRK